MSHRIASRRVGLPALAVGLLALFVVVPSVQAQPMAENVPADAIVYVGWLGWDAKSPGYANSRWKAVLDAAEFQKLLDDTLPKMMAKIAEKDRGAAEAINIAKPILMPMLKHPTAMWIGKPVIAKGQEPKPVAGFVCKAGPDAEAMHKQIVDLMAQAPDEVKKITAVKRAGDLVTVAMGYGMDAPAGGLAGTPGFKAVLPHAVKDASFMVYVDVAQVTTLANDAIAAYADGEPQKYWPRVRDAIGLPGVKAFVWSSGFDGREWCDHLFVHAPEPRSGLVALADAKPLSDAALKSIPSTATMAGASRFDAAKLVAGLRKAVTQVEPDAARQVDEMFAQASQKIGMDVEKDLLAAFGEEWVYYVDPQIGGRGLGGIVMLNRLRDPKKAEGALTKLQGLLNDEIAKNIPEKDVKIRFLTTKSNGTTIHYLGTPLISPAWAIKGEYLVVALFPQMVAGATDYLGAGGKSILDNPGYQAMRQRLGVPNANGVSFADLQQTAPDAYSTWVAISRLSGFADMFGIDAPAMLMPPLNRLMPHLAPAGSVSWVDKDGMHAKAISPFPGATLIATDPMGGIMGMMPAFAAMGAIQERRMQGHGPDAAPSPRLEAEVRPERNSNTSPPAVVPLPPPAPRQ